MHIKIAAKKYLQLALYNSIRKTLKNQKHEQSGYTHRVQLYTPNNYHAHALSGVSKISSMYHDSITMRKTDEKVKQIFWNCFYRLRIILNRKMVCQQTSTAGSYTP